MLPEHQCTPSATLLLVTACFAAGPRWEDSLLLGEAIPVPWAAVPTQLDLQEILEKGESFCWLTEELDKAHSQTVIMLW